MGNRVYAIDEFPDEDLPWRIRFLLGIPLGSDIDTGYTYIMESMPKGKQLWLDLQA